MDTSNVITLFENEVSVVQDTCEKSVFFYIYLEYALDIEEFNIIDEDEACMSNDNRFFTNKHNSTIEIYDVYYYLHKEIIDHYE